MFHGLRYPLHTLEGTLLLPTRLLLISVFVPAIAPWGLDLLRPFHPVSPRPALESRIALPVSPNLSFRAPRRVPPACDRGQREIAAVTNRVARGLAAARIEYSSDDFADCSAMAHRVLDQVANRCDGISRPTVTQARSARAIAAWYTEQGLLSSIHHPMDVDDALAPGAIAFFGPPGRRDISLDQIFHMGVVVSVERDEVGRVQSYRLFQGRRPGTVAGITNWHRRSSDPPLGNGNEELVAVAWPAEELVPAGMSAVADVPGEWVVTARQ